MLQVYKFVASYDFVKNKYHKKCKHDTFLIPKAIRQTKLNQWTKEQGVAESQQGNSGSNIYVASVLVFKIYLISLPQPRAQPEFKSTPSNVGQNFDNSAIIMTFYCDTEEKHKKF